MQSLPHQLHLSFLFTRHFNSTQTSALPSSLPHHKLVVGHDAGCARPGQAHRLLLWLAHGAQHGSCISWALASTCQKTVQLYDFMLILVWFCNKLAGHAALIACQCEEAVMCCCPEQKTQGGGRPACLTRSCCSLLTPGSYSKDERPSKKTSGPLTYFVTT